MTMPKQWREQFRSNESSRNRNMRRKRKRTNKTESNKNRRRKTERKRRKNEHRKERDADDDGMLRIYNLQLFQFAITFVKTSHFFLPIKDCFNVSLLNVSNTSAIFEIDMKLFYEIVSFGVYLKDLRHLFAVEICSCEYLQCTCVLS